MYKNLAFLNGIFLAIMVFLNGLLSKALGPYLSTLIYHLLGLALILTLYAAKRPKRLRFHGLSPVLLLPGVLSIFTIMLNNMAIPKIGVTLAIGAGLFGQLVMSTAVEHFGLFGRPVQRLKKDKLLGLAVITAGIGVMILF